MLLLSAVAALLCLLFASTATAERAFGFEGPPHFHHHQHHTDSSASTSKDTDVGSESSTPPFNGGLVAIIVVGCFVLVVVALAVVVVVKITNTNKAEKGQQQHVPERDDVDSTKASDTSYEKTLDPPKVSYMARVMGGDGSSNGSSRGKGQGSVTFADSKKHPGTPFVDFNLRSGRRPDHHHTPPLRHHTHHSPTRPPPGFPPLPFPTSDRQRSDDSVRGCDGDSTSSSGSTVATIINAQPPRFVGTKIFNKDVCVTPKRLTTTPPSPTTPPPLFSPHSPTESPRDYHRNHHYVPSASTFAMENDAKEVAM